MAAQPKFMRIRCTNRALSALTVKRKSVRPSVYTKGRNQPSRTLSGDTTPATAAVAAAAAAETLGHTYGMAVVGSNGLQPATVPATEAAVVPTAPGKSGCWARGITPNIDAAVVDAVDEAASAPPPAAAAAAAAAAVE